MKKLLKNKNFILIFIGQMISNFGSNIQQYVLSIYVLFETDSVLLFVLSMVITTIPGIIFAPIAGVVGDWFDRKKAIVLMDLLNGVVLGGLAISFFFNDGLRVGIVIGVILYLEVVEIFYASSNAGIVPSIVSKDQLFEANSLTSTCKSLSSLFAPVIGITLYVFVGIWFVLLFNAVSFVLSAVFEMIAHIPKTTKMPVEINLKVFFDDMKKGFKIIKEYDVIITIIIVSVAINIVLGGFSAVGVIYILKQIGISEVKIGYYTTSIIIGSIVGSAVVGPKFKNIDAGKSIEIILAIIIVIITLFGIVVTPTMLELYPSNLIPYVVIVVFGFTMAAFGIVINIIIRTLLQQYIPNEQLGKASAVFGMFMTISIPLSMLLVAVLYEFLSISNATFAIVIISLLEFLFIIKRLQRIHYKL